MWMRFRWGIGSVHGSTRNCIAVTERTQDNAFALQSSERLAGRPARNVQLSRESVERRQVGLAPGTGLADKGAEGGFGTQNSGFGAAHGINIR